MSTPNTLPLHAPTAANGAHTCEPPRITEQELVARLLRFVGHDSTAREPAEVTDRNGGPEKAPGAGGAAEPGQGGGAAQAGGDGCPVHGRTSRKKPPRRSPPLAECRKDPEAAAEFTSAARELAAAALRLGQASRRIEKAGHHTLVGVFRIGEYGEREGVSARIVRSAMNLARVLEELRESEPDLERLVLAGERGWESAGLLVAFLDEPDLLLPGERMASLIERRSTRRVEALIRERRARLKDQTRRFSVHLTLTAEECEELEVARAVASQKAQEPLSRSEAVGRILRDYLKRHDLLAKTERRRRMADTRGRPGRGIPAQVRRYLLTVFGRRCAVWYCDCNLVLQIAHILAKWLGGSQEALNLLLECLGHHRLLDLGILSIEEHGGRRMLVTKDGLEVGEAFTPPPGLDPKVLKEELTLLFGVGGGPGEGGRLDGFGSSTEEEATAEANPIQ
jgi:hypothetical protein